MGGEVDAGPARRAFDWLFRNRTTGGITVGQLPNAALAVFIAAAVVRRVVQPTGWPGTVVALVATSALLSWAVGEVARGVNPFRRLLGLGVLAVTVVGLATR